jgi:phosphatidylglycerophosphate synthase
MIDASAQAWQKQQDVNGVFWERKLSPFFTRTFVKLGLTPNQTTLLWGGASLANSYVVYRAIVGDYWLIPAIWAIYLLCSVIDCADGEVARATNNVNPVAGKLLDGICHRVTEYSLLGVFGAGAWTLTGSNWALPLTVLLLTADAMYSYVYERRLSILRVGQRITGHLTRSAEDTYAWGTPWRVLSVRQKLATITGLFHYKSVYPVIGVAYLSGGLLAVGLTLIGIYKHWKWIRLVASTLSAVRESGDTPLSSTLLNSKHSAATAHSETSVGAPVNGR